MDNDTLGLFIYLDQIEKEKDLQGLDNIVENSAFDDSITNTEYETIYRTALEKAQTEY